MEGQKCICGLKVLPSDLRKCSGGEEQRSGPSYLSARQQTSNAKSKCYCNAGEKLSKLSFLCQQTVNNEYISHVVFIGKRGIPENLDIQYFINAKGTEERFVTRLKFVSTTCKLTLTSSCQKSAVKSSVCVSPGHVWIKYLLKLHGPGFLAFRIIDGSSSVPGIIL